MGLLYPAQEKYFKGPWLIGQKELLSLDKIIEPIRGHIKNAKMKELKEEKKPTNIPLPIVEISVMDKEGKALVNPAIADLLKDIQLENFKPIQFEIEIYYNEDEENYFELFVENNPKEGSLYYELDCYDHNEMQEISYIVKDWIQKNKPNKVNNFWYQAWFFAALIAGVILLGLLTDSNEEIIYPTAKNHYKPQIENIIKTGINDSNRDEALTLILKLSINYVPKEVKPVHIYKGYNIRLIIYSIILLILSISRPITLIGLGRNKLMYGFYKWYTYTIYIIGASIIMDQIVRNIHWK